MLDARFPKSSIMQMHEQPELDSQMSNGDNDGDLAESNQCSFSLLDSDDEFAAGNDADHSGSQNGPDFTNLSSSLTDAIVSSPSSLSNSVDECSLTRPSETKTDSACTKTTTITTTKVVGHVRAKHDRRTAKQLTERKRRDRINALLDTLRNLILRLLRKNPRHHRKLEKADILELVVSFLKRELQKSRQSHDSSGESKATALPAIQPVPIPNGQETKSSSNVASFVPDMFVPSTPIPVTYQPNSYDPYSSNFVIPVSQLPTNPYVVVTDPIQNPVPTYPAQCPATGFYPFRQYNDAVSTNSCSAVSFNTTVTNRRPLGSIENMNRMSNFPVPTQTSPMKEARQTQKSLNLGNIQTRGFTSSASTGMEVTYKFPPPNDENEANYSHLQNILNSAPSQTLWRPYV